MENKLQELTQKLYNEGLSKGRQEADTLVADAQAKAKKIVADAQSEANQIVAAAKAKADELSKNTMTEISLAGKQAVSALKQGIADMIMTKGVSAPVSSVMVDPAFVKEILLTVAKNWSGASGDDISLTAMLPAALQSKLGTEFEKSVQGVLGEGGEVVFSGSIKSGFKVGPKQGGYYISFTDADFDALLGEYLRPKVSQILYSEQK